MALLIGAIADDSSGTSDLANTLACEGMNVVQEIGIPGADTETGGAEAVAIALKSRTAPVKKAVDQLVTAYAWLRPKAWSKPSSNIVRNLIPQTRAISARPPMRCAMPLSR